MRLFSIIVIIFSLSIATYLFWPINNYQKSNINRIILLHQAKNNDWRNAYEMLSFIEDNTNNEIHIVTFIELLGNCNDASKWASIINATKNSSPNVRSKAVCSLANYQSQESKQAVIKCINDNEQIVRIKAAYTANQWTYNSFNKAEWVLLDKALTEYEEFMLLRTDDWSDQFDLGNYFTKKKEFDKAINAYNNSLIINPNQILTLVNIGMAYAYMKDYTKAKEYLNQALKLDDINEIALVNYALLMVETKNIDEAESIYRKIFKLNPESAQAAYNIGIIAGSENILEAEKWTKVASKLEPENSNYQYSYAYYLIQNKKPRQAVNELINLIDKNAYYVDAYMLLAQLYNENGESESAVKLLNKALLIPNTSPRVKTRINNLIKEINI